MRLALSVPGWATLAGGTDEATWLADRDRKHGIATEIAGLVFEVAAVLQARGDLFICSPAALMAHPFAADWYVSLASLSMKTLGNIREGPRRHGITHAPRSVCESLRDGKSVASVDLKAFSAWINAELEVLWPPAQRDARVAEVHVALILGGRVIGIGQNRGGDDAVTLLRTRLIGALAQRGEIAIMDDAGHWQALTPVMNWGQAYRFRFNIHLLLEFVPGGDRPDLLVALTDRRGAVLETIAVAEIKGRKDLSNVWESWMPTVHGHIVEWTKHYPDSARLFFGTQITDSMIEGLSLRGTSRAGLKEMHALGQLHGAYNLSKLGMQDPDAVKAFDELVEQLVKLAGQ